MPPSRCRSASSRNSRWRAAPPGRRRRCTPFRVQVGRIGAVGVVIVPNMGLPREGHRHVADRLPVLGQGVDAGTARLSGREVAFGIHRDNTAVGGYPRDVAPLPVERLHPGRQRVALAPHQGDLRIGQGDDGDVRGRIIVVAARDGKRREEERAENPKILFHLILSCLRVDPSPDHQNASTERA